VIKPALVIKAKDGAVERTSLTRIPWQAPHREFKRCRDIGLDTLSLYRINRRPRPNIRPVDGVESIIDGFED